MLTYGQTVWAIGQRIRQHPPPGGLSPWQHSLLTAHTFLSIVFDQLWEQKGPFGNRPQNFFQPPSQSGQAIDESESGVRTIELAETIINFEMIPGFEYVKDNLLWKVTEDEMVAMYLGKMLKLNGHRFSFVLESDQGWY